MPRIKSVRLSTPEDDEGLRACLRATPMGGRVRLVLEREPCFFDSLRVHREAQVVTALGPADGGDEEILGFAVRAADSLWLEGRPQRVGYLGGLRTRPDARDLRSIKLGWKLFRELHEADPIDVYFTTIQATNDVARKLLESGRFGIPPYHRIGTIVSHVFSPRAPRASRDRSVCDFVSGETVGWKEIARFLAEVGPNRNFFPALEAEELESGRLPGLELGEFTVAIEGSRILGLIGRWKQTSFKQVRVLGYPLYVSLARPFANASSIVTRTPHVPAAGSLLESRYLCLPCVREDRVDLFARLLARATAPLPRDTHCVLGLTEDDPLRAAMSFLAWKERFALYAVAFEGAAPELTRVPYIESAVL